MDIVWSLIDFALSIVGMFCLILKWLLVIRIILSWVGVNPFTQSNELLSVIFQVTDFILSPFRRLPLQVGMFDLSPMVAIMVFQYLPVFLRVVLNTVIGWLR